MRTSIRSSGGGACAAARTGAPAVLDQGHDRGLRRIGRQGLLITRRPVELGIDGAELTYDGMVLEI